MASAKNRPTPAATVKINTLSGMAGTCFASTCKSGSATVTTAPSKKLSTATICQRRMLPTCVPMASPSGIMEISAPSEKKPMPTTSSTAPAKNSSSVPSGIGATVMLSTSTIPVIGNTEDNASRIFSFKILFNYPMHSPLSLHSTFCAHLLYCGQDTISILLF